MARPSLGKVRVIISLPPELLKWVDAFAAGNHQTRAETVEDAVKQYREREDRKDVKPRGKR